MCSEQGRQNYNTIRCKAKVSVLPSMKDKIQWNQLAFVSYWYYENGQFFFGSWQYWALNKTGGQISTAERKMYWWAHDSKVSLCQPISKALRKGKTVDFYRMDYLFDLSFESLLCFGQTLTFSHTHFHIWLNMPVFLKMPF